MSNQWGGECGRSLGPGRDFAACVAEPGPTPGIKMTISCQQNPSDGRMLVDASVLPAGTRFKVVRYRPASADSGWSHGSCDVEFTRR